MKKLNLILLITITASTFSFGQYSQNNFNTQEKPKGNLYAYAYFDYFYKFDGDTANWGRGEFSREPKDAQAFTFRRIYLGYNHQLTDNISGRILLEGSDKSTITTGDRGVFIKAMYVAINDVVPNASIYVGQAPTPTWSFTGEPLWGYRSVEKSITDFRGLGGSNDLGVMLMGDFDRSGLFGYSIMIGNGTGSKAENNKYKKFYGFLSAKPFDKKLYLETYGDFQQIDPVRSIYTMKFLTAFKTEKFTVGVETIRQVQRKFYAFDDTDIIPLGISFFTHGSLIDKKLKAFGRVDYFNPDMEFTNDRVYSNTENFYDQIFVTAGLDWSPVKDFRVQPNIWLNFYNDKRQIAIDRKADIVGRFTFYYTFTSNIF
jgi:hypothetical protein